MQTLAELSTGWLLWYLVPLLLSLPAHLVFRRFVAADTAWALARLLSPHLIAWLALSPAYFGGGSSFTPARVWTVTLAWVVASLVFARTGGTGFRELRHDRPAIVAFERFYLLFFGLLGICLPWLCNLGQSDSLRD